MPGGAPRQPHEHRVNRTLRELKALQLLKLLDDSIAVRFPPRNRRQHRQLHQPLAQLRFPVTHPALLPAPERRKPPAPPHDGDGYFAIQGSDSSGVVKREVRENARGVEAGGVGRRGEAWGVGRGAWGVKRGSERRGWSGSTSRIFLRGISVYEFVEGKQLIDSMPREGKYRPMASPSTGTLTAAIENAGPVAPRLDQWAGDSPCVPPPRPAPSELTRHWSVPVRDLQPAHHRRHRPPRAQR